MNDKFDELTMTLAQSVTRRGALKKFGVGLAGVVLASFALANKAHAAKPIHNCTQAKKACAGCLYPYGCTTSQCVDECATVCNRYCTNGGTY